VAVHQTARTSDGQYGVLLHEDQTGELVDDRGRVIVHRTLMHKIGAKLAELGYEVGDLVLD
jgi:hypothetical protein